MAEKHLVKAIFGRFKKMNKGERIRKIRKLASKSDADERFIRQNFPDLYIEAYTTSNGEGGSKESDSRPVLYARQH